MARAGAGLLVLALAAALPLPAQVLYKWIDTQGKVHYGDKPPKDFKGEVTRLEPDPPPASAPALPRRAPVPAPAPAQAEPGREKGAGDIASQRRARREGLHAQLVQARDRVEAARKALDEAGSPGLDERQVVQQRFAKGTAPATPRSNCREVIGPDKRKTMVCPVLVPNEGYYERIRGLEEAVARAEEDLAAAERAYRAGVD